MKVKTVAIIEIVLGALVVASFICPAPCSKILFGSLVLAFGVVLLVKPK